MLDGISGGGAEYFILDSHEAMLNTLDDS